MIDTKTQNITSYTIEQALKPFLFATNNNFPTSISPESNCADTRIACGSYGNSPNNKASPSSSFERRSNPQLAWKQSDSEYILFELLMFAIAMDFLIQFFPFFS